MKCLKCNYCNFESYAYVVALTSDPGSMQAQAYAQGRGPIMGHFDPDLKRTYQKQYGGRLVRHLVYHPVEESWYRELSQICHCARTYLLMLIDYYAYELVKTRLNAFQMSSDLLHSTFTYTTLRILYLYC